MTVSAEVQKILDDVEQNKSIVASVDLGMKALQQQVADLQNQIANQTPSLSAEDKAALASAASDLESSISTLQSDIPANTQGGSGSGGSTAPPLVPPVGADGAPTGMPGSAEQAIANGPSNHPAGGSQPLMPTSAFDPNPTATAAAAVGGPPSNVVPTPGGFVVNPPSPVDVSAPMGSAGAVAPSSVVPNVAGGQTVLAGQVAPGAPISNTGGVESATDASGAPLATSDAPGSPAATTAPAPAPAPGSDAAKEAAAANQASIDRANQTGGGPVAMGTTSTDPNAPNIPMPPPNSPV